MGNISIQTSYHKYLYQQLISYLQINQIDKIKYIYESNLNIPRIKIDQELKDYVESEAQLLGIMSWEDSEYNEIMPVIAKIFTTNIQK